MMKYIIVYVYLRPSAAFVSLCEGGIFTTYFLFGPEFSYFKAILNNAANIKLIVLIERRAAL